MKLKSNIFLKRLCEEENDLDAKFVSLSEELEGARHMEKNIYGVQKLKAQEAQFIADEIALRTEIRGFTYSSMLIAKLISTAGLRKLSRPQSPHLSMARSAIFSSF